jgi:hypothetical protein
LSHPRPIELERLHPPRQTVDDDAFALAHSAQVQHQADLLEVLRHHLDGSPARSEQEDQRDRQQHPVAHRVQRHQRRGDGGEHDQDVEHHFEQAQRERAAPAHTPGAADPALHEPQ